MLSPAYDRPVWGPRMERLGLVRDALRSGTLRPRHLDAAQLVKHAFGLVTEARRFARTRVLAEPAALRGQPIPPADHARHRVEIADFAARVAGDEVLFTAASCREWLGAASGPATRRRRAGHPRSPGIPPTPRPPAALPPRPLALIAAVVGATALAFAWTAGWLSPGRLTPRVCSTPLPRRCPPTSPRR
ncbi:MAG: hypothetical protein ACRYG6_14085 [Janthinobacterium lividum]